MKSERSNVHMTSNVYPVQAKDDRIDFSCNAAFTAQIADREALKKLVQMHYGGINDHSRMMQIAQSMQGLTDWQVRRIGGCDSCSEAEPGDKPWGTRSVNGSYISVCRCDRTQCSHFAECRPDKGVTHANK